MVHRVKGKQGVKRAGGFTLLEVILAIAISAFVAVLGYSALSTAIKAAEQHEKKALQLANVQLALTVLERDIHNAVKRAIVDEYSSTQNPLLGGEFAEFPLQLTRRGWDNPSDIRRGELQRLRYEFVDGELWREHWLVLDRTSEENSKQRVLLIDQLERFEVLFLKPSGPGSNNGLGGEWQENWDAPNLPLAIEVRLHLEHFGQVKRVFEILSY